MNQPSLGVMILAHQRPQLLIPICKQIFEIWPDARVDFTTDRGTLDVAWKLHSALNHWNDRVRAFGAPFSAIDHRENFIELRDWQLQRLHATGCRHIAMWDDDHLLADPEEAKRAMDEGADLVYATKAYFWDSLNQINLALPRHTSILFSRRVDGDRWTKMVGAPEKASALPKAIELAGPLLDVGYMTETERQRIFQVYKRAGKIDQLTTGLVQPPALHRVREQLADNKWYQLLESAMKTETEK